MVGSVEKNTPSWLKELVQERIVAYGQVVEGTLDAHVFTDADGSSRYITMTPSGEAVSERDERMASELLDRGDAPAKYAGKLTVGEAYQQGIKYQEILGDI